jgi:hypothetical protein
MAAIVLGLTGALVYTRRGSCAPAWDEAQESGAAMKGETSSGKRDASASRATRDGDTAETRRVRARTLGQMTAVSQRETHLIPQPPRSRAVAPIAPVSRRGLLPLQAQHLSHVWRARAVVAVIITVLASVAIGLVQAWQLTPHSSAQASGLGNAAAHAVQTEVAPPDASGHGPAVGPWSASAASIVVLNAPAPSADGGGWGIEPCRDPVKFLPVIDQWSVPPGCYANIYKPNQANYPFRPGFGWCNWWVRENHLAQADITENLAYRHDTKPVAGAAIFFYGNVQGADSAGHWAQVVAIAPDNYWILISEMNFDWRGAGWGKIDYRYVHVGPGVIFTYP